MKKGIALLLVMLLLTMTACGKEPAQTTGNDQPEQTQNQTEPPVETEPETQAPTEGFDPASWGVADMFAARNENPSEIFYINFPEYTGRNAGYGKFSEQLDGSWTFVSGQNSDSPAIGGVSELFPAYFDQVIYSFEAMYGLWIDNMEIRLDSDEAVTIGQYQMHRFEGVISLEYDGNPVEYQYVAYATMLNSNGAYAYWMAYDVTEDQVNGEAVAEYAYNMARTFREEG